MNVNMGVTFCEEVYHEWCQHFAAKLIENGVNILTIIPHGQGYLG